MGLYYYHCAVHHAQQREEITRRCDEIERIWTHILSLLFPHLFTCSTTKSNWRSSRSLAWFSWSAFVLGVFPCMHPSIRCRSFSCTHCTDRSSSFLYFSPGAPTVAIRLLPLPSYSFSALKMLLLMRKIIWLDEAGRFLSLLFHDDWWARERVRATNYTRGGARGRKNICVCNSTLRTWTQPGRQPSQPTREENKHPFIHSFHQSEAQTQQHTGQIELNFQTQHFSCSCRSVWVGWSLSRVVENKNKKEVEANSPVDHDRLKITAQNKRNSLQVVEKEEEEDEV